MITVNKEKPIQIKSKIYPGKTYLGEKNKEKIKRELVPVLVSSLGVTNCIEGTYRRKFIRGRSFVIEYVDPFGIIKEVTLSQLQKLNVIPKTVILEKFFEIEKRIKNYFLNHGLDFFLSTIENYHYTPKSAVEMIKDYIDHYKFDPSLWKMDFFQLLKYCCVVRPDMVTNIESVQRINEILIVYKAKPNELFKIQENSKSMSDKQRRAPYGSSKTKLLSYTEDLKLKKNLFLLW